MSRALTPPSLDTHVENEDVEREEKEDVDDGEGDEAVLSSSGKVTMYVDREVGGGEGRKAEGHIEGGEGVDRHGLWKRMVIRLLEVGIIY